MAYEIINKTAPQPINLFVSGNRQTLLNNGRSYVFVTGKRNTTPEPPNGWTYEVVAYEGIKPNIKKDELYHVVNDEHGNTFFDVTDYLP